jgi:PKD repeat protein
MKERIKKILAILLVVLFVVTVTAGAVSAIKTDNSGNAPLKFIDKTTSTTKNPVYKYTKVGVYTAT